MTTKPVDIDRVEALLGVTLEPWQKFYLEQAFGPEARGISGVYRLTRDKGYERRMHEVITEQYVERHRIQRAIDAERATSHARDCLLVGLGVGFMAGALVLGLIFWAVS